MTPEEPAVPAPALRASDTDRERVVGRLQTAVREGRLTLAEFDERSAAAYAARTHDDLAVLTRDLPPGAPAGRTPLEPPAEEAPPVIAVFSGTRRGGRWRPARRERAVAVFGGVELDLREARLPAGGMQLSAWAVFGGVQVTVPEGTRVELSGFSLFGGRHVHEGGVFGADAPGGTDPTVADDLVLRVHAVAVFGGVDVRFRAARGRWG